MTASSVSPLPPPSSPEIQFPWRAIVQGIVASLSVGTALYYAWTWLYFDLLFDFLGGLVVGWAISNGLGSKYYPRRLPMFVVTLACVFLVYLVYNGIYLASEAVERGQVAAVTESPDQTLADSFGVFFLPFIEAAVERTFLGLFPLSAWGAAFIWALNFSLATYVAWSAVDLRIRLQQLHAVPGEVFQQLLVRVQEGYKRPELQSWLSERGWTEETQQQAAFDAVKAWSILRRFNPKAAYPTKE